VIHRIGRLAAEAPEAPEDPSGDDAPVLPGELGVGHDRSCRREVQIALLEPDCGLVINVIDTIRGFTAISMYPKLWALLSVAPTRLVSWLIDLALQRAKQRRDTRRSYDS
jgi:hypothetical protein